MRRVLYFDGAAHPVRVESGTGEEATTAHVAGEPEPFRIGRLAGSLLVSQGRKTREAMAFRQKGAVIVEIAGARFVFDEEPGGAGSSRPGATGRAEVRPPMPGKVARILRKNGDSVEEGEGVLVYEAMKMQNEIRAPVSGVIAQLSVTEGSPLEGGEVLFVVEPES